ncbi:class I SAM-dependent DNA methyltransferase [Singulisphaera acidiphila]|uniref:Methyltransferase family protein n=1 Tax=Singulisphaera acidiphila (strain ATCC BAA-1392 / DSM 18658 / VKM B-2454 / MOB10) TaxID=886293 RepID=L0DQZ9_SINAD|nr:class I SAM-dependent methyltransferase [Singulisphaera acidiphila]AGA31425.1 methyltransferase family protein [Singulisphaera acidiphila DSM 18658]
MQNTQDQDRQWSRHAAKYDELFLDALDPSVENPIWAALDAVPKPQSRTIADLGCGTGPLLPRLVGRFGRVVALDFAPAMIARARTRVEGHADADSVTFETRAMHDLDDFAGQFDVVVAINSLVMPDVREIDRTLRAIRASLRPGGQFLGVLPSMDAIHYHTMLLMDQALDRGLEIEEAERSAAFHAEHQYYEFAFGRFQFLGLRQKFWQPFEIRHRMAKAGFASVELGQVLYPWDESMAGGADFADHPRSWDWSFVARP